MNDQEPGRIPVISIIQSSIAIPWRKRAVMFRALLPISVILITLQMIRPVISTVLGSLTEFVILIPYVPAFTVFAVTCHRLILLGDDSVPWYGLSKWSKRESRFIGWSLLGWLALAAISMLVMFFSLGLAGSSLQSLPVTWVEYAAYFVMIPGVYVVARFSILLPATAVDQRHDLTWAWETTERNGWRLVLVVGTLPFVLWYGPQLFVGALGRSSISSSIRPDVLCMLSRSLSLSLSFQYLTGHSHGRF